MAKKILVVCDEAESAISLQQIPPQIKSIFKPAEGHTFVDIDFSQMEYRVAASLSQDKAMLDIFNSDEDFYSSMASKVYKKDLSEVSQEDRAKVKQVSLGIMYGMGIPSIAKKLRISEAEATKVVEDWKASFPEFVKFQENVKAKVVATGKARSFFGRYRDFGNPSDLDSVKINEGFNTVIQSTAADLIKVSMVMTDKYLSENKAGKIKLTLHDELLFEVQDEKVEEVSKELEKIMMDSVKRNPNWCDFRVKVNKGKTWAQASK